MRIGSIRNALGLDAAEDGVEFRLAHLERVMMDVEAIGIVIKIERETLIHLHGCKIADRAFIERQSEDPREELRRCDLVAGRHDGVVEFDGH